MPSCYLQFFSPNAAPTVIALQIRSRCLNASRPGLPLAGLHLKYAPHSSPDRALGAILGTRCSLRTGLCPSSTTISCGTGSGSPADSAVGTQPLSRRLTTVEPFSPSVGADFDDEGPAPESEDGGATRSRRSSSGGGNMAVFEWLDSALAVGKVWIEHDGLEPSSRLSLRCWLFSISTRSCTVRNSSDKRGGPAAEVYGSRDSNFCSAVLQRAFQYRNSPLHCFLEEVDKVSACVTSVMIYQICIKGLCSAHSFSCSLDTSNPCCFKTRTWCCTLFTIKN